MNKPPQPIKVPLQNLSKNPNKVVSKVKKQMSYKLCPVCNSKLGGIEDGNPCECLCRERDMLNHALVEANERIEELERALHNALRHGLMVRREIDKARAELEAEDADK